MTHVVGGSAGVLGVSGEGEEGVGVFFKCGLRGCGLLGKRKGRSG